MIPKKSYTFRDSAKDFDPIYLPKHKDHCSFQEYVDINKDYYKLVSEKLINGEESRLILPHRMGEVYIKKKRTPRGNFRKVDFNLSKQIGQKVYHRNTHSNGFYAKFYYDRAGHKALYKHKKLYMFTPTRTNARALAKAIKEKNTIDLYN